ncbi:hypothetical protein RN001_015185 [Aquatica leii]|uniref:UDP-glycosyltransferases domain-containing protein n=1 Tax=Aquatica leii TaxID=1421715 RepID=A0AAN7P309_9COLE|nr:hypothetical protein RN001_015185 [Aquatica leii]
MAENSAWVAFAFAKRFNCPIIPISSQACESRSYKSIGNPEAFFYTSITTNETLTTLERVKHTVLYAIGLSFFYVSRLGTMEVIKKQFGPEYRDAEKIFEKTSVVFENTNNIMHQIRSLLPGVVQLGGLNLYNAHPKIPKDLQQVLDNATNGFIYVSLGTVVNGNEISAQLFLETFNELSYTVLWKTDNETLSNVSSHVYTSKWFPQFNILRHKNIKAFITQGGALSMDEGIHNEVPMIGIPVFLDQFTNVAKMVKLGICIKIQREFLHKHLLKSKILEIAQNSSYKRNIVNLNKLIMDQPQTPLDKAVFWTEYVIRHKSAAHLKEMFINSSKSYLNTFYTMWFFNYELPNTFFGHSSIQKLINNENEHFDLVMAESSSWGAFALAERFNCPIIPIASQACDKNSYNAIGNLEAFFSPNRKMGYQLLSIFDRLQHTLRVYTLVFFYNLSRLGTMEVIKKHVGYDYADVNKIFERTSVIFENTNNALHPVRPLVPGVIQVGGLNLYGYHSNVSQNLQRVLDDANNGFIYVSLGTVVDGDNAPAQIFLETFKELPYTVLWKTDNKNVTDIASNVHVSKWFPQFNILKHKNIKVFITQGGALSVDEGIYNEVPMIGIPVYLDHFVNTGKLEELGIGLRLHSKVLNKELFKGRILEVAKNSRYKQNIVNLKKLVEDQPQTPLDRAVFWTEYVIRHKGASHLKCPMINIPFYQYYLLDVIAVVVCASMLALYVLRKTVSSVKYIINSVVKVKML